MINKQTIYISTRTSIRSASLSCDSLALLRMFLIVLSDTTVFRFPSYLFIKQLVHNYSLLHLTFDLLFKRPADQPLLAILTSFLMSKPFSPIFFKEHYMKNLFCAVYSPDLLLLPVAHP